MQAYTGLSLGNHLHTGCWELAQVPLPRAPLCLVWLDLRISNNCFWSALRRLLGWLKGSPHNGASACGGSGEPLSLANLLGTSGK